MSLCLSYNMTDTSKAKECSEESNTSFWTTCDDTFRFSNLTTSHMSILKESGPFVAIVLSYWDNVLGPRLQHVWRGAGDTESQVGLNQMMIFASKVKLIRIQQSCCIFYVIIQLQRIPSK